MMILAVKKRTPHFDPARCLQPASHSPQGERKKREFAKKLRVNSTKAERVFWRKVRDRQIEDCKFRRQCPIDMYIVDFVCFERRLIIELDGGQHCESMRDKIRDEYLSNQRFKVIRFWNNEVLENMEGVLSVLVEALKETTSPLAGEGWGEGGDNA